MSIKSQGRGDEFEGFDATLLACFAQRCSFRRRIIEFYVAARLQPAPDRRVQGEKDPLGSRIHNECTCRDVAGSAVSHRCIRVRVQVRKKLITSMFLIRIGSLP